MSSDLSILQWYLDAGVDEVIGDEPWDRTAPIAPSAPVTPPAPVSRNTAVQPDASPKLSHPAPSVPAAAEAVRPAPPPTRPPDVVPQLPSALLQELAAIGDLESLRARLDSFDGCALKATAMNTVFGVGPADADLMIIGEAPGEQEDRQGVPFVGPSGNLLNLMLNAIGFAREQVYVTNTIFWRPPGNRTPTPLEVQSCTPFLHCQINLVQPQSAAAGRWCGGQKSVAAYRGHNAFARPLVRCIGGQRNRSYPGHSNAPSSLFVALPSAKKRGMARSSVCKRPPKR